MSDIPADWAIKRAAALSKWEYTNFDHFKLQILQGQWPTLRAFARYIAEHEEAPVDPLLIEARALVQSYNLHTPGRFENATRNFSNEMRIAMDALERGMELAKEQNNGAD